jgi:hypothetical protein
LREVDLPGRVRAPGQSNLKGVGEFLGGETSQVAKGEEDFTKQQVLEKGWTKWEPPCFLGSAWL